MTSATSYFNKTVLKKDLTRFAPVWILLTILMCIILPTSVPGNPYAGDTWAADGSVLMAVPNLMYGFLVAALLFGDLFVSKLCYSLHAMPLKREGWFLTHLIAGILFMLIPYGATAVVCMFRLGASWSLALVWLGNVSLEYLFFFGLAALCAMLAGNRIGMLLIYGVINGFSMLIYSFVTSVFMPFLPGLMLPEEPFARFCPVLNMMGAYTPDPLWIFGILGVLLLIAALLLYRKRNLETAGDFLSFSWIKPLFLLVYTFAFSMAFFLICSVFLPFHGLKSHWFLIPGLILGYFTGLMLITRTLRVFSTKRILGCGIILIVFAASLMITWQDPLDLITKQPDPEDVVSMSYSGSFTERDDFHDTLDDLSENRSGWVLTDPEEIAALRALHSEILEDPELLRTSYGSTVPFYISYELKNGDVLERRYRVPAEAPAVKQMRHFLSNPEFILGYRDWDSFAGSVTSLQFTLWNKDDSDYREVYLQDPVKVRTVLEAVRADCEQGLICNPLEFFYNIPSVSDEVYSYRTEILHLSLSGGESREVYMWEGLLVRYLSLVEEG